MGRQEGGEIRLAKSVIEASLWGVQTLAWSKDTEKRFRGLPASPHLTSLGKLGGSLVVFS